MVWYAMVWYCILTNILHISPHSYFVGWYNHQTIDCSSTFVRNYHPFLCVDLYSLGRLVACRSQVPVQARPWSSVYYLLFPISPCTEIRAACASQNNDVRDHDLLEHARRTRTIFGREPKLASARCKIKLVKCYFQNKVYTMLICGMFFRDWLDQFRKYQLC